MAAPHRGHFKAGPDPRRGPGHRAPLATKEFRELCLTYCPEGVARLVEVMRGSNPIAAIAAIKLLFEYGIGKPAQLVGLLTASEAGAAGEPMRLEAALLERFRRLMTEGAPSAAPADPPLVLEASAAEKPSGGGGNGTNGSNGVGGGK